MKPLSLFLLFLGLAAPAWGALSRAQLDGVYVAPPSGAHLDLQLAARDAQGKMRTLASLLGGRPAFVNFVDYTCTTLCGTDLALLSRAITRNRLDPSRFRIIVIGIDPKDSAQSALAMERKEIPASLWPDTTLLLPDKSAVERTTAALGYHYIYDPEIDQFAHPAVVYLVGADGLLRRTLSPFALGGTDLHSVLNSPAPQSSLFQRIRLLCYAYDPVSGLYTLRILSLLKIACIVTVLMIAAAVTLLHRFRRHAA